MGDYFIGLMTGSSADAVDASLVDFDRDPPYLIGCHSTPYPQTLRADIIRLAHGNTLSAAAICTLDAQIGEQLAQAAQQLISITSTDQSSIRAIGSHGQTICHLPDAKPPGTLQLGDPAQIVEATNITTVADFRHRDMAAGGQGAPFAPAFHAACLRSINEDRCILNLGGIANITVLPADPQASVIGFDTGPANALLDLWCKKHTGEHFDADGRWASTGQVDQALLQQWLTDSYFAKRPPKSTGRNYFNEDWLIQLITGNNRRAQDIQATLSELTAQSVAEAVRKAAPSTERMLVCGGGLKNDDLIGRLRTHLQGIKLDSTQSAGVSPYYLESMLVAWLAAQAISGLPGNLPSVTGAKASRVCGAIYPA